VSAIHIPGYSIRSRLGSGGQALVYLAVQESLGRSVALKVLHPVHSQSTEFTARFLNEGRILADLNHANVITIHDIGVAEDLHYLSMELVEGGDLKQRIAAGLAPATALEHLEVIARCLQAAHEKNIVHRDIKPANVLFRLDGTLLLSDFGIAKRLDADGDLTISGTTLGSPSYLSPEQAQGRPLDGRADLYSLGAMAFEMLSGDKPYAGRSEIDTIFAHINAPVPRLPDRLSRYQPLIERTMAKLPAHRYPNAGELARDLGMLRDETTAPLAAARVGFARAPATVNRRSDLTTQLELCSAPPAPPRPRRRASLTPFAAAAVLLAGAWWSFTADNQGTVTPRLGQGVTSVQATPARPARAAPAAPEPAGPVQTSGPAATVPASSASEQRLARLLSEAELALAGDRLTTPPDDSAYGHLQAALELDPGNPAALQGIRRIAERYAGMARRAMARGLTRTAAEYLRRGLAVEGDHPELLALQVRISRGDRPGHDEGTPVRLSQAEPRGETPLQLWRRVRGWFN
jgi:serine/threonine-protein kinase PpkA